MVAPFTVINGNNQQALPKIIVLPEDLLTIKSHEQLHNFLSRVASAAMEAAIYACGSQEAAFIRLGSKAPHQYSSFPSPSSRPTLVLAPARTLTAIRTFRLPTTPTLRALGRLPKKPLVHQFQLVIN